MIEDILFYFELVILLLVIIAVSLLVIMVKLPNRSPKKSTGRCYLDYGGQNGCPGTIIFVNNNRKQLPANSTSSSSGDKPDDKNILTQQEPAEPLIYVKSKDNEFIRCYETESNFETIAWGILSKMENSDNFYSIKPYKYIIKRNFNATLMELFNIFNKDEPLSDDNLPDEKSEEITQKYTPGTVIQDTTNRNKFFIDQKIKIFVNKKVSNE